MLGSRTENKMMQIKELSGLNAYHRLVGVTPFIRFMPFFSNDGSDNDSTGVFYYVLSFMEIRMLFNISHDGVLQTYDSDIFRKGSVIAIRQIASTSNSNLGSL